MRSPARPRRGFALLAVLWTMALVAVVVTRAAVASHTEALLGANLLRAARLRDAADGAVHLAAFRVIDRSDRHWDPHAMSAPVEIDAEGLPVTLQLSDESDLIDLNTAPPEMLQTALRIAGVDPPRDAALADEIVAWRTPAEGPPRPLPGRAYAAPRAAFRSLDELALVPGLEPALVARLAPHLTLYSGAPPTPGSRDTLAAATLRAMKLAAGYEPPPRLPSHPVVVRVVATAHDGADGAFTRTAILRLDPAAPDEPMTILVWN